MVRTGRSYRVSCLLGQGAFGAVYLADTVGTGLERRVAIKLLRPEKAATPGLVGRLRDEARMLAALRHRAIVRVDDLMELDGTWAIVMEYVEGCDLAELLKLGAIPPVAALAVVEEVASALHAAYHQAGPDGSPLRLIHRDIKPSNLRVTAQGEVKILDFGVARAELQGREEQTQEAAFGTVPYMAPERFYGEDTHAGDVYALGVTLFEMLTGVKPGKSAMDADRAPPGDKLQAQWAWLLDISQPLHDLIAQMLSPRAQDRPTARETARLAATIRASLPGEPLDEWVERVVPGALRIQEERRGQALGERTGTVLFERSGTTPVQRKEVASRSGGRIAALVAAPLALVVAGAVAALIIGPALWFGLGDTASAPKPAPVAQPVAAAAPPAGGVGAAPGNAGAAPVAKADKRPDKAADAKVDARADARGGAKAEAKAAAASPASAPAVAESPVPPAEVPPAEAPPPPAGPGRVVLAGDAQSVSLRGEGGAFGAGEVPAGSYAAEVRFTDGTTVTLKSVGVEPGKSTTLRCSVAFQNCKVSRSE